VLSRRLVAQQLMDRHGLITEIKIGIRRRISIEKYNNTLIIAGNYCITYLIKTFAYAGKKA
jgi:hypothetical protein